MGKILNTEGLDLAMCVRRCSAAGAAWILKKRTGNLRLALRYRARKEMRLKQDEDGDWE